MNDWAFSTSQPDWATTGDWMFGGSASDGVIGLMNYQDVLSRRYRAKKERKDEDAKD